MPNDTTLQSVFDYAKQPPLSGGDFPTLPIVYVTFVEHYPNSHPPGSPNSSDLVMYSNGPMTLSANKKILSGEFKIWRNIYDPEQPLSEPPLPEDAFAEYNKDITVSITVSDTGQVTHQRKLKGNPIGGMPPQTLNAVYDQGVFLEKTSSGVRSLSFTLGTGH